MPMRKNHHKLYLYQQEQTLLGPGIWLTFQLQLKSMKHNSSAEPYLCSTASIWSDRRCWPSQTSMEWETLGEGDTACLDKVSAGVSGHLHQLKAPSSRMGWELCPTHIAMSLSMLPQRGWELHVPGKVHSKSKGQLNSTFLESELWGKVQTIEWVLTLKRILSCELRHDCYLNMLFQSFQF